MKKTDFEDSRKKGKPIWEVTSAPFKTVEKKKTDMRTVQKSGQKLTWEVTTTTLKTIEKKKKRDLTWEVTAATSKRWQ